MKHPVQVFLAASLLAALAALPGIAAAEPYLAVEAGLKCGNCHVDPGGGGKRTPFGMLYARNMISAKAVDLVEGKKPWTGDVSTRWFGVGGDFRGGYESIDVPGSETQSEWAGSRATVYAELRLVPNLLSVYADQKIAPAETTAATGETPRRDATPFGQQRDVGSLEKTQLANEAIAATRPAATTARPRMRLAWC